jgi:transposase InsO family protein
MHSKDRYIITATYYLMRWAEEEAIQNFSTDTVGRFIFENIISQFGCPKSLNSVQGSHFISNTITPLMKKFIIQHHKRSPYHLQDNGTMEAFNKILESVLTRVCCENKED